MSKKISYSGILSALSLLFLYITGVTPSGKLALIAAASYCVGLCIVYAGLKFSVIAYVAVSLLGLVLIPNKMIPFFYIMFFGNYPFLKYLIEKTKNIFIEWLIKIPLFNIYVFVIFYVGTKIFMLNYNIKMVLWMFWVGLNIAFIIYDVLFNYVVTKFLSLRRRKIL